MIAWITTCNDFKSPNWRTISSYVIIICNAWPKKKKKKKGWTTWNIIHWILYSLNYNVIDGVKIGGLRHSFFLYLIVLYLMPIIFCHKQESTSLFSIVYLFVCFSVCLHSNLKFLLFFFLFSEHRPDPDE